jgi:hypothetical protein
MAVEPTVSAVVDYLEAGKNSGKGKTWATGCFYRWRRERKVTMVPHVDDGRPVWLECNAALAPLL